VSLVGGELVKVHAFLRQKFDHYSIEDWTEQQERCTMLDASLNEWRQSEEVLEALSSHSPTSDALFVLINATLNTQVHPFPLHTIKLDHRLTKLNRAVIIIYQRLAFPASNAIHMQEPWYHAIQRCLDECNNLAESIRRLGEDNLENNSPHFVSCMFIAARFLLGKCIVYIMASSRNIRKAH
jgi:hypothetical protein